MTQTATPPPQQPQREDRARQSRLAALLIYIGFAIVFPFFAITLTTTAS